MGEYARREKDRLVTTNGVEGYFSLLKRGVIGTFHHVSEQHLPLYLAEFDHRHNHRYITDGERTVSKVVFLLYIKLFNLPASFLRWRAFHYLRIGLLNESLRIGL
jgi:ISXO2-like transposase domain